MNIVIDTNIFRKDRSFQKSDMLFLIKLSTLNLIDIHLPWVVKEESLSQNVNDITSDLNKVKSMISSIKKKGINYEDFNEIDKISSLIDSLNKRVDKSVNQNWDNFLSTTNATVHEILESHGKSVMSSYFKGDPPYSSIKNRNDIPDAFIYMSIKSLSSEISPIHFITDDQNLRHSVNQLKECFTYNELSDFYESEHFEDVKSEYQLIEHYSEDLIEIKSNIELIKENMIQHILGNMFAGNDQVISKFDILQHENEGAIQDISDVEIRDLEINRIKYIDNIFYIPIIAVAKFSIEFFINKGDYNWDYPNKNISILEGNWNDYVMLMIGDFNLQINSVFTLTKDEIVSGNFDLYFEPLGENSLTRVNEQLQVTPDMT